MDSFSSSNQSSHQVQHKAPLFACTETQPALESSEAAVQHAAHPGPPTSFSLFGFSGWQLFVWPKITKPRGCVQQKFQWRQQRDQTQRPPHSSCPILSSFSSSHYFSQLQKFSWNLLKKCLLCLYLCSHLISRNCQSCSKLFLALMLCWSEFELKVVLINFILWVMDHIWKGFLFVENYQHLFPSPPLHSDRCFYNLQLYYFGSESALALTCFRTKRAAVFRKTNKKSFNKPTAPSCPAPDTSGWRKWTIQQLKRQIWH